MATEQPCSFRHYDTISPHDLERRTAGHQFPEALCGGMVAPNVTVTPRSQSAYAQTGKSRPDARVQRDSNATLAWNIRDVPGVTANVSEQTATSQILYRTTNNAASPAPRDLCAGDERPARRLSDAVPHPGAAAPGPADAGGTGTAAGPAGAGSAPGQREALSAEIAQIIRAQRDRDFVATLAEWQRASGTDRAYWRRYVRLAIAEERARLAKSRAALRAAATRNQRKDAA